MTIEYEDFVAWSKKTKHRTEPDKDTVPVCRESVIR